MNPVLRPVLTVALDPGIGNVIYYLCPAGACQVYVVVPHQYLPITVRTRSYLNHRSRVKCIIEELLITCPCYHHRFTGNPCQPRSLHTLLRRALSSETSSHKRCDDPDGLQGHAQFPDNAVLKTERRLSRGPDRHLAILKVCKSSVCLYRCMREVRVMILMLKQLDTLLFGYLNIPVIADNIGPVLTPVYVIIYSRAAYTQLCS